MKGDRNIKMFGLIADKSYKVGETGVFDGAFGDAKDDRRAFFLGSSQNSLDGFEIVDVEMADGIAASAGILEHSVSVGKHKSFLVWSYYIILMIKIK